MDPFSAADSTAAEKGDRTSRSQRASAMLRRSTGLFNLKLDNAALRVENLSPPPPTPDQSQRPVLTPDASSVGMAPHKRGAMSLKRPHPFSSAKPTKSGGFLARSNAAGAFTSSPAGQKRLHLTMDGAMTPDLSFRGAKPVQTAFASSGLQSKRLVSQQSPKARVPETPCKRPSLGNDSLLGDKSFGWRPLPDPTTAAAFSGASFSPSKTLPVLNDSPIHHTSASRSRGRPLPSDPHENSLSRRLSDASYNKHGGDAMSDNETPGSTTSGSHHDNGEAESPLISHSRSASSRPGYAPVDRLERFSLSHINVEGLNATPETPKRFSDLQTSTPHAPPIFNGGFTGFGAMRQESEAATMTPGTAIKPSLWQSADPANSLDLSPPTPLAEFDSCEALGHHHVDDDDDLDRFDRASTASSSGHSDSTKASPRTPDVKGRVRSTLIASSSTESQASPRPRRQMRILGMHGSGSQRQKLMPPPLSIPPLPAPPMLGHPPASTSMPLVPPVRVETPLGRSFSESSPRTPAHTTSSGNMTTPAHLTPAAHAGHTSRSAAVYDELLASRFDRAQNVALGEFSAVFVVATGKARYAVKRTKRPMLSQRERLRRQEEVDILRTLSRYRSLAAGDADVEASPRSGSRPTADTHGGSRQESRADPDTDGEQHVVQLIDDWEACGFGYIMTEYCENGDLNRFLLAQGRVSRLEEWRVWKILAELALGLQAIHAANILHLDLKPANVFVTFEGHLKIGDFGLATRYPVPAGFEREGDREYIAPEILERQEYGKPADVFSLGLMMVEIAANIVLPDNGVHWHRLRSGDLSDAGQLSSGDLASASRSDASGLAPPAWAPPFLVNNSCLLDKFVSAMLAPDPRDRPSMTDMLMRPELELVNARGQAGAIVYEGEYGPEPDDDSEVWQRA